jgi:hypothetical protein
MILEFLLAWATELHGVVVVFALAAVAALVIGIVGRFITNDISFSTRGLFIKPMDKVLMLAVGLSFLTTIPTVDSLWRVRVGLLKLELASPENVKALGGHIEEVVKKLECKHLGVNCAVEAK